MLDLEAAGQHAFLRDMHGEMVSLCNDGGVYCNITTFDHTQPAVRLLWEDQVRNAVANGSVDGIFADHAYNNPRPHGGDPLVWELCNGKRGAEQCYNFTASFGAKFVAAHTEMLNYTQDMISKTTHGPVICGPYAKWAIGSVFKTLRKLTQKALHDPTAPFIFEANRAHNGACNVAGDPSLLAGYLCAMEKYTYLVCFANSPPEWFDEYDKPLGPPVGPAVLLAGSSAVWQRNFSSAKGITIATYNADTEKGTVWWAGEPSPVPTPAPVPTPKPPKPVPTPKAPHPVPTPKPLPTPAGPTPAPAPYCTKPMKDTGLSKAEAGSPQVVGSVADCCALCKSKSGGKNGCAGWSWHTEQGGMCHLHKSGAHLHPGVHGCFSGYVNSTLPR
jgi:hypothetical protein